MRPRLPARLKGLVSRWNWKSAIVSSAFRALIFFAFNLSNGLAAALVAMRVELLYRAVAAGWYGALTERFSQAAAGRRTTLIALMAVPGIAHLVEFTVHWIAGTPQLGISIAASIGFSVLTTGFNLFAMRRGVLIVGPGGKTLREDFATLRGLVVAFAREWGWPSVRSI